MNEQQALKYTAAAATLVAQAQQSLLGVTQRPATGDLRTAINHLRRAVQLLESDLQPTLTVPSNVRAWLAEHEMPEGE